MVIDPSKDECPDLDNDQFSEEDLEQSYFQNLTNGKKNLLCSDYSEAVSCFQAACSIQSERFGDTAPECAEAFFYYGRALLELARVENTVLGNALKGVPETEDSDSESDGQFEKTENIPTKDREQMRENVEAAMATENDDSTVEDDATVVSEKPAKGSSVETETKPEQDKDSEVPKPSGSEQENKENTESSKEEDDSKESCEQKTESAETGESSTEADQTATADESEGAQEDPDDISNMQLAWEMLELAKVLYLKKPESESCKLMIAQCQLKLGELGLEVENYTQAIEDFNECLSIHEDLLADNDRRLAETHYNLGLAYSFDSKYDPALQHYRSALGVLERRIDSLNEIIEKNEDKDDKAVLDECSEVGEIKALLPDINSRIEDVLVVKRQQERRAAVFGESSSGFSSSSTTTPICKVKPITGESSSSSSSAAPPATNDISHLIRRKRTAPISEKSSDTEIKVKKLKTEIVDSAALSKSKEVDKSEA